MVWSKRLAVAVVGGSLVLAACGGDGDTDGDSVAADGDEVVLPEPAAGPVPDLPVAATSMVSPLPEIAVRRLNGEGGWSQFRNELPSEQPLLIWFWAPF